MRNGLKPNHGTPKVWVFREPRFNLALRTLPIPCRVNLLTYFPLSLRSNNIYPSDRTAYWESRYHELENSISWLLSQSWVPLQVKQSWGTSFPQLQPPPFSNCAQIPAIHDLSSSVNDRSHDENLNIIFWEPNPSNLSTRPSKPPELHELDQFLHQITNAENWNLDWIKGAEVVDILLEGRSTSGDIERRGDTWRSSANRSDWHEIIDNYAIFTKQITEKAGF